MSLALSSSLSPSSVSPSGTSTLTVTRSGGVTTTATILANNSFDTGSDGWSLGGASAARTTSSPRSGSHCMSFGLFSNDQLTRTFNLTRSGQVSFWVRLVLAQDGWNCGFSINGVLQRSFATLTPLNTYVQFTHQLNAGSNALRFFVYHDFIGASINGSIRFDDIIVQEGFNTNTATDALTIALSSGAPSVATVPGSLTILANQLSATANVTGVAVGTSVITATHTPSSTSTNSTLTVATPGHSLAMGLSF